MNRNEELERIVIGNVIVRGHLEPWERQLGIEPFAFTPHKQMWGAILELDENGSEINSVTVHRTASQGGGFLYGVADVSKMIYGLPGNTKRADVQELMDLHTKRKMERFASRLDERAKNGEGPRAIIEDALKFLSSLADEQVKESGNAMHVAEVFSEDVRPRLEAMARGEQIKVPTGFDQLDSHLNGGIGLGELCVLGAKPKCGKSAFMLQMAKQTASTGNGVYICSREMLNFENGFRLIVQESDILRFGHFKSGISDGAVEKSADVMRKLSDLPLYLDDRSRTVDEVVKEVRLLNDSGRDIRIVFVDYAQLMQVDDSWGKSRANVLESIVYGLKDMAMRLNVAVVVLAQFNREGISAESPKMFHFEGSSSIEKAGNIVLLWTLDEGFGEVRHGRLWIEAARSSPLGEWGLEFEGSKAKFNLR